MKKPVLATVFKVLPESLIEIVKPGNTVITAAEIGLGLPLQIYELFHLS